MLVYDEALYWTLRYGPTALAGLACSDRRRILFLRRQKAQLIRFQFSSKQGRILFMKRKGTTWPLP
jgi:hypothetical protein